jgi:hypothetical protein
MDVKKDFRDLLALFSGRGVEYLVAGSYALAFHGAPRYTGDIDLYVRPTPDNADRILRALSDFGFRFENLIAADFLVPEKVIQLGVPPVRVDLITSLTGVTWDEAQAGRAEGRYGDVSVFYLGRSQLVANKRATGRKKDLADLEALGEA